MNSLTFIQTPSGSIVPQELNGFALIGALEGNRQIRKKFAKIASKDVGIAGSEEFGRMALQREVKEKETLSVNSMMHVSALL